MKDHRQDEDLALAAEDQQDLPDLLADLCNVLGAGLDGAVKAALAARVEDPAVAASHPKLRQRQSINIHTIEKGGFLCLGEIEPDQWEWDQ